MSVFLREKKTKSAKQGHLGLIYNKNYIKMIIENH